MKPSGIITLLSDFSLSDAYVAMLKGVILGINPDARLVDITHEIRAGLIIEAAGLLLESFSFFPKGTVHLAIVDPGVGSNRRPIAIQTGDYFFVGPDNGLFWPILPRNDKIKMVHLLEKKYHHPLISPTFHGREIFAPVAAHLSRGLQLEALGPRIKDPVKLDLPQPYEQNGFLYGQIMRIDHFGNLLTNIQKEKLHVFLQDKTPCLELGRLVLTQVHSVYADAEPGEALALVDSSGYLEIAVNRGRAADLFGIKPGDILKLSVK
jgi:hypothetical protein